MPAISRFLGIVITMYYSDHARPHFHARYAGRDAAFDIETLEIGRGSLPARQVRLIRQWAVLHQDELHLNWERARLELPLAQIAPL